ncbi:MAG: alpha/beta fold hydrolase [Alphaproteobacteria bacterium]|nr:alpha/beta fold hydrolase [Alphaproteobacteria bacterium]
MALLTLRDGDHLYYEEHGAGPPLVLVSGLGGVGAFWSDHVPALAERFRVVLHDHRGTGQSSAPRREYSVDQMADDLLQLMGHLDIARADLIGHSTGGAMGQTLALDQPDRIGRLVLSATWTAPDDYFKRLFKVRGNILSAGGVDAYVRSHPLFMFPSSYVRDRFSAILAGEKSAIESFPKPEIMLSRIRGILKFDRKDELGNISAPTLVMGARDDITTPAYFSEELGRLIPNAETVILETGGHFFPIAEAETFRKHVLAFLDRA